MGLKSKYDANEEKRNMHMIRKAYAKTKLDGSFQRYGGVNGGSGWTVRNSAAYIDSLLNNAVFNKIILADVEMCHLNSQRSGDKESEIYFQALKNEGYEYVSIDGNNSSSTVAAFLDNHKDIYVKDTNGKKKYFKDFSEEDREDILYTEKLDVTVLRRIGIREMCDLFRRLNMSTHLNAQEFRQARWSELSKFIREISNGKRTRQMFKNFVFVNADSSFDKRSHEEIVAQLALKLETDYKADGCSKPGLDKFYETTISLQDKVTKKITEILNILGEMSDQVGGLANSKGTRLKKGQLLALMDLISDIDDSGYKIDDKKEFFKWFTKTDHLLRMNSKNIISSEIKEKSYQYWIDSPYYPASWNKSRAALNDAFQKAKETLFTNEIMKVKRTSKDVFSFEEKEELLIKQDFSTRTGKSISSYDLWTGKLEADHVVPVSVGGPTKISNGELMFKIDNRKKGAETYEPYFDFQELDEEDFYDVDKEE